MKYFLKVSYLFFMLVIFFICVSFIAVNQVSGEELRDIEEGDILRMDTQGRWLNIFNGSGAHHVVMYFGEENGVHRFIESGPINVHKCGVDWLDLCYENFTYFYVHEDDIPLNISAKGPVLDYAEDKLWKRYQNWHYDISHWDLTDEIDITGAWFQEDFQGEDWTYRQKILKKIEIWTFCLQRFVCTELPWAGYMETYGINICCDIDDDETWDDFFDPKDSGLGDDSYQGVYHWDIPDDDNIQQFNSSDPLLPLNYGEDTAEGTVDCNLDEDDPINNTWTTIQKGIDNLKTLDVLYIKNGDYSENIKIDKSMILIGENKNNVRISGSINMIDDLDYELPNYGKKSILVNVNMSGNDLLFHFNNDSKIGENYSSSNIIYDYSGQENNGTNNEAIWNTTTIKGNGSFDFDGIDDSINRTSISALAGENITVSSWVYWNGGSGNRDPIISQSNATHGYCLYVNVTSNKPVFCLDDEEVISSEGIENGWHHIVGTHNETMLKVFIDGILHGTATKTGSGSNLDGYIGYDNISGYFNGSIDEMAVWNRTLSNDEIAEMYKANYGVVFKNFTLQNGSTGFILGNRSEAYNFILSNFSTGIQMKNLTEAWIAGFNISDCDTAININSSNSGGDKGISVIFGDIKNCSKGMIVNSSSYTNIGYTDFNCSDTYLKFNDCDINKIIVSNCTSSGNIAPDTPSNVSGVSLGDTNTNYSYDSVTNDSECDPIYYRIFWGDDNISEWLGPYSSNETVSANHSWTEEGGYYILVQAMDVFFNESAWSEMFLFKTEEYPPLINNVSNTPYVVGFGGNITITAEVVDDSQNCSGIQSVYVNITYPDSSNVNYSMSDIGNDTYEYVFDDTWTVGQYNYTIWAVDNAYNTNSSTGHSYNVYAQATISVCTIEDVYGDNESVNLTDPPGPPLKPIIGHELLDDDSVLHIWNKYDSYYFNTSSGIQITNHYEEYWSHNVLMLGYYDNDEWNLIYRTDELSGFNKDIESDDETYVNATLWKDLSYSGYDFRLAIRYHLGVDDNELTVIPYIKNIDDEDIPYTLGFAWEINDIQVDMTPENDYIEIDDTWYYLNGTIDETYTNLDQSCYYIREDKSENTYESLYLRWDEDLNYKVMVESRDGQYNAPVTLGIKIGTLDIGQEKYTELFWHDASEVVYYFDSYDNRDPGEAWATNPGYMVDGNTGNYASTTVGGDVEFCDSNTCSGTDLGSISKVELRAYGYYSGNRVSIILRPVHNGTEDGNDYVTNTDTSPGWSDWVDITDDNPYGTQWVWNYVENLDCDVVAKNESGMWTLYCSKVEIRVTYNQLPVISNPYPADDSTGVPLTPSLNITIVDPDGDLMDITWLSNGNGSPSSSSSWQVFGTNNSVGNGTYHQVFANATENGKWWYWKVNVSDEDGYTESDVFRFYTGNQSKIENIGFTYIKGYLLMQVQFYNETLDEWVVANDTVNETSWRRINNSEYLALDTIFNENVNTSDLLASHGSGTYRVYACFRDPDDNVLVCNDESLMEATYPFTVTYD